MRLILTTITSLFIVTTASAEVPQVCKDYFERDSFADNDLHRGKSEIRALLDELYSFPPLYTKEDESDLALDLYLSLHYERIRNAMDARDAFETAEEDFSDGEITEDALGEMVTDYYFNAWATFVDRDAKLILKHIGADHRLSPVIESVNECFVATLEQMDLEYRTLLQPATRYVLDQRKAASE